jgi:hypothetical protein
MAVKAKKKNNGYRGTGKGRTFWISLLGTIPKEDRKCAKKQTKITIEDDAYLRSSILGDKFGIPSTIVVDPLL